MEISLRELAEKIGASLCGGGDYDSAVKGVNTLADAESDEIAFLSDRKHFGEVGSCRAGGILTDKVLEGFDFPQLVVDDVNTALIEVMGHFSREVIRSEGIDGLAKVAVSAVLGDNVTIEAGAIVEERAEIGDNSFIGGGCRIGEGSKIGSDCRIENNVVIYHDCYIGNNVFINANCSIGANGFGYRPVNNVPVLIPHNGSVIIEDHVELGANSCIDRGKFGATRIGAYTKIDNLVQIGHNAVIGKCCLIAALTGIAGSVVIGDGVILAGQVGVADNLKIGDGVKVGAKGTVLSDVDAGSEVLGFPARDAKETIRAITATRKLPELLKDVRELRAKVKELEASKNDKK